MSRIGNAMIASAISLAIAGGATARADKLEAPAQAAPAPAPGPADADAATIVPVTKADPTWAHDDPKMDAFIDALMAKMTLQEKIGQLNLLTSDWQSTGPTMRDTYKQDIAAGRVGAIFNAYTAEYTRQLQELAVNDTRLKIPLLFGYDVIHGHRTIFPISLGEAASWDMKAVEKSARISAQEASAEGIQWTFSPMVDIARDPRWGRVSEGAGRMFFSAAQSPGRGYAAIRAMIFARSTRCWQPPSISRPMGRHRRGAITAPSTFPDGPCSTLTCRHSRRLPMPASLLS